MDGRAQLQSLAHAINTSAEVEAAWAGTGGTADVRKACGICGDDQPVRIPFLRHVCRACAAIWVPGICNECAHTSITFTMDGELSRFATCGCGGRLRQVAYVPKPRATVDPEIAMARQALVHKRKRHAQLTSRTVLVAVTAVVAVSGVQLVRHNHAAPAPAPAPVVHHAVQDDPALSMAERGRRAAARLTARGQNHDVFACAAELPAVAPALGSTAGATAGPTPGPAAGSAPNAPIAPAGADAGSSAFLASCLAG